MKKILLLVLALMLCCASSAALAAGKLSVVQENYYTIEGYSVYSYGFAKVQNIGDRPIKVHTGLLDILDENGDTITSTDSLHSYAEYLEPNEYTYVELYSRIEGNLVPAEYIMTLAGKSSTDYVTLRLQSEGEYQENVEISKYSTRNYMYAKVTNDSEETVFNLEVLLVLLDDEDNILYMDSSGLLSDQGLTPGSSMIFKQSVPSSFIEYFEENDITPSQIEVIAYTNLEQ